MVVCELEVTRRTMRTTAIEGSHNHEFEGLGSLGVSCFFYCEEIPWSWKPPNWDYFAIFVDKVSLQTLLLLMIYLFHFSSDND